tara:strand:+ start:45 stop:215 length:171 start_codon:yes stop_codon:yes gene_type:complete
MLEAAAAASAPATVCGGGCNGIRRGCNRDAIDRHVGGGGGGGGERTVVGERRVETK